MNKNKPIVLLTLIVCCGALAATAEGNIFSWAQGNGTSPFRQGPVKPWMLKACIDTVVTAAPLLAKFANHSNELKVGQICQDIKELKEPLEAISGHCWIGKFKEPASNTLNAVKALVVAQSLQESARRISTSLLPVSDIADDLEKMIAAYPLMAANCN